MIPLSTATGWRGRIHCFLPRANSSGLIILPCRVDPFAIPLSLSTGRRGRIHCFLLRIPQGLSSSLQSRSRIWERLQAKMSIVDVAAHQHYSKSRALRGKYYERKAAARAYQIYYILTITGAFLALLICTAGIFLLMNKLSRAPAKDVCHDPHVASVDLEVAGEPTAIQEQSVAGHGPEMIVTEFSPLQHILTRDLWEHPTSDEDENTPQRMQQLATMEESSLVIGETVVPYDQRGDLSQYIQTQMEASKIISKDGAKAILAMIHVNSSDLLYFHAQTGISGSLRNSLTLALCSQKGGNIHFMLVILQVEPHLGWNRISSAERRAWNLAMKASLECKMRKEAEKVLGLAHPDSDSPAKERWSSDSLH